MSDGFYTSLLTNVAEYNKITKQLTGNNGCETITDTQYHEGDFAGILVLEDAVISDITLGAGETGNSIKGITLIAGLNIPMNFTKIKLSSGKIRAYKR